MNIEQTDLPGVVIITPRVFKDVRGFFFESYNAEKLKAHGIEMLFVQDNHSCSTRGTLRGLHFQLPPMAQDKLVRCVRGVIWDVAVDIRAGSPTFGRWVGVELSAENHRQMWIPAGFGHGFLVLSGYADFLYKTTDYWVAEYDRAVRWDDSTLAIDWPMAGSAPVVSAKDAAAPTLDMAETYA